MPVAVHYGIDPVHFGVMFVLNICIGIVHPPISTNMFITCALARNCSISHYTREAVPFLIALLLLLAVVTISRRDTNPSAVFWLTPTRCARTPTL